MVATCEGPRIAIPLLPSLEDVVPVWSGLAWAPAARPRATRRRAGEIAPHRHPAEVQASADFPDPKPLRMEGPNLVVALAPVLPASGLLQSTTPRGRRRGRPGGHRRGRWGRGRLYGRQAERLEVALHQLAQFLEEVPPFRHRDGIGRFSADALGVGLRVVADDDLDARTGAQPCQGFRGTVRGGGPPAACAPGRIGWCRSGAPFARPSRRPLGLEPEVREAGGSASRGAPRYPG